MGRNVRLFVLPQDCGDGGPLCGPSAPQASVGARVREEAEPKFLEYASQARCTRALDDTRPCTGTVFEIEEAAGCGEARVSTGHAPPAQGCLACRAPHPGCGAGYVVEMPSG